MNTILARATMLLLLGSSAWGQSLKDTTLWMRNFVSAHSLWQAKGAQIGNSSDLSFSGCDVKQALYQDGKPLNGSLEASTTTYSLADLDSRLVKVYPGSGTHWASVGFETTNSQDKISVSGENCKRGACVSSWVINFDGEANAARFAKAMRHAIALCGGKTSLF